MFDILKVALIVGIAAISAAIVCLGYVAWENAGSRNLALATGTLLAAAVLLCIQLHFELRESVDTDFISAEYTIDRAKPEIRTSYEPHQGTRPGSEIGASTFFANSHPGQFDGDREKLTKDMALFSLLAYLGWQQFDWQIKRVQFTGKVSGTITQSAPGSKPEECTLVTTQQIQKMLSDAGNSFAGANLSVIGGRLCLPPASTMQLLSDALIMTCPFCEISFTLESSGGIRYGRPGIVTDYPQLPNGEATLEFRRRHVNWRRLIDKRRIARRVRSLMPSLRSTWRNEPIRGRSVAAQVAAILKRGVHICLGEQ
jgi:hypothetical protein